jgi:hypothetical protein
MKTLIVIRILMVAGIVVCGLADIRALGLAPIVCLTIYTWIGFRAAKGDRDRLEALGIQVYFTAYTSTIAAFAGMLLRTYLSGHNEQSADALWLMASLGILCTVLGLLAMTTLLDLSTEVRPLPVRDSQMPSTSVGTNELVEQSEAAIQDTYSKAVDQLVSLSGSASNAIRELTAQIDALTYSIQNLSACASEAADAGQSIRDTTRELKAVVDAFVRNLAIRLEGDASVHGASVQ